MICAKLLSRNTGCPRHNPLFEIMHSSGSYMVNDISTSSKIKTRNTGPLVGRQTQQGNMTSSSSSSRSTSPVDSGHHQRPALCESPLFGMRRQLAIVSQPTGGGGGGGGGGSLNRNKQTNYSPLTDHLVQGNRNNPKSTTTSSPTGRQPEHLAHESTLNSIPKHITRQQIHYAFSIMDTNSDGLIDSRDLGQMLANLGIPIDESILAHVLGGASKRGDRRMSEQEFLEWFAHLVPLDERAADEERGQRIEKPPGSSARSRLANKWSAAGKWRKQQQQQQQPLSQVRPSSSSSSLAAVGAEPVPVDSLRKRRGSGSGLALMRSLSSSAPTSPASATGADTFAPNKEDSLGRPTTPPPLQGENGDQLSSELEEARSDLCAAFCVFDLDGDGFITLDEVRAGLKLLGESWSSAELNQFFNRRSSPSSAAPSSQRRRSATLRANDLRQRISIEDFVQMLL